ncbi:MAG: hypothetical protein P4M02_01915 [Clostridia bacterium]|nr:hypothetical protein [Clostridia bacterium]
MKKGIQLLLMALAGVIVLAVTLVVFFVGFISFRKAEIDYVALTFVLVSELLFFIGAALLAGTSQNKVFTRSGVMTALALYWVSPL